MATARRQRVRRAACAGASMPSVLPPIFVISLVRDTERREAMTKELAGIDFQFFDAVDGRELDLSKYRNRMRSDWWRVMRGREMSPGMIGCFLSHYALWERLVETGTAYAVILEDDTRLDDNFTVIVEKIMENAAATEWDVVVLSMKRQYPIDRSLASLHGNWQLVRHRRRIGGVTRGYLIRREAAEALLHYCWRIRAPIGWLHGEWWQSGLTYLAVDPAVVRDAELLSLIGPQSEVRRTMSEHIAAGAYRLADRLYLRAACQSGRSN